MGRSRSPINLDDRRPARFHPHARIVCKSSQGALLGSGDAPPLTPTDGPLRSRCNRHPLEGDGE